MFSVAQAHAGIVVWGISKAVKGQDLARVAGWTAVGGAASLGLGALAYTQTDWADAGDGMMQVGFWAMILDGDTEVRESDFEQVVRAVLPTSNEELIHALASELKTVAKTDGSMFGVLPSKFDQMVAPFADGMGPELKRAREILTHQAS
jgi:hypothetical protein